jgi:K+-transporting ATPase A subunit
MLAQRQRKFNRSTLIFIGILVAMMLVVPALNFLARARR